MELPQFLTVPLHALTEAVLTHALLGEPVQIQLGDNELGVVPEALGLSNKVSSS